MTECRRAVIMLSHNNTLRARIARARWRYSLYGPIVNLPFGSDMNMIIRTRDANCVYVYVYIKALVDYTDSLGTMKI